MPLDPSSDWAFVLTVILATFLAEDATLIAVGLAIGSGAISPLTGMSASFLGVLLGDVGLWAIGAALDKTGLLHRFETFRKASERGSELLNRHTGKMILAARFVPGLRLPVYLAAGLFRSRLTSFVLYAVLAVILWTPLLVGLSALLGSAFAETLQQYRFLLFLPLLAIAIGPILRYFKSRRPRPSVGEVS